jgi:mono/diheme cytochrome c family protein
MLQARRRVSFTAAAAAVTALALMTPSLASAQAGVAPDAVASAIGQIIYQRYCASCHGTAGKGDGPMARDLSVVPTDLTRLAKANKGIFPFSHVVQVIDGRKTMRGHGTPDMPVWGEIFPKTEGTASPSVETAVARITHYVWSIQQQ